MSAYLIFTREETLDPAALEQYSCEVAPTLAGHTFKLLSLYGQHQDLEGPPTEGSVLMEFPDAQAAMQWFESPAYQRVREHRHQGARYRITLLEST